MTIFAVIYQLKLSHVENGVKSTEIFIYANTYNPEKR